MSLLHVPPTCPSCVSNLKAVIAWHLKKMFELEVIIIHQKREGLRKKELNGVNFSKWVNFKSIDGIA